MAGAEHGPARCPWVTQYAAQYICSVAWKCMSSVARLYEKAFSLELLATFGNARLHTLQTGIPFALIRSPRNSFTQPSCSTSSCSVYRHGSSLTHANHKLPHASHIHTEASYSTP
eukprot:363941-Chlamydomonas_euryale.AAC.15